jgi:hypothetical protein
MATLKDYLEAVAADADSTANVVFDEVDDYIDEDGDSQGTKTSGDEVVVLSLVAAVAEKRSGQNGNVAAKKAWYIVPSSGKTVKLEVDGVDILHSGSGYGAVSLLGRQNLDISAIESDLALTRATDIGATLDVYAGGAQTAPGVKFLSTFTSASANANGENYTNAQVGALGSGTVTSFLTSYDVFTLTIGSYSVTATIGAASATGAAAASQIGSALMSTWDAKWGTNGTSKDMTVWESLSPNTGTDSSSWGVVALQSTNAGSRGLGETVAIAWAKATAAQISTATAGTVTKTSALAMDWVIGTASDTTDNAATTDNIVITIADNTADATDLLRSGNVTFTGSVTYYELSNDYIAYGTNATSTNTTTDNYPDQARADVTNYEGANEGIITTPAADAEVLDRTASL